MGADLIVVHLEIPKKRKPDWQAASWRIAMLAVRPVSVWPKAAREDVESFNGPVCAAKQLAEDLKILRAGYGGGVRMVTEFTVGSTRVLLTGGPTWGDAPTEEFDVFCRLINAGVTKAAGFRF